MNYNDMKEIVDRRDLLVVSSIDSKDKDLSLHQYNILINDLKYKDLKFHNYCVLKNIKSHSEKNFSNNFSDSIDYETLELIKELLSLLKNIYPIDYYDIPTHIERKFNEDELITITKNFFSDLNNVNINSIDINDILSNDKVLIKKNSFYCNLKGQCSCLGKTYPDFINKISYIMVNKDDSINDIYSLVHECMHSINFKFNTLICSTDYFEVIAYLTGFLLNDYLRDLYPQDISYKGKSILLGINNTCYNLKKYFEEKELDYNNLSLKDIYLLSSLIYTILPYSIYKINNTNDNISNLLLHNPKNYLIENLNYLNIDYQDIINNTKELVKRY